MTPKVRVSELYTSIQGEGPFVGQPTQFLRFGGCNMRCPGWPCDTLFAVEPKYRDDWSKETAKELADRVPAWPRHICLTGGEPMIQKDLQEVVERLHFKGYTMEMFSNGSIEYPEWVQKHVSHVMMDWKLKGSGEADNYLHNRIQNAIGLTAFDGIKFVVTDKEDLRLAYDWTHTLRERGCKAQFWVGAAWGRISEKEVVDYILWRQLPWNLNVQVHKHIWPPDERGV